MEGLQIGGCLHRALAFRSKALLFCSLPLLLLLLLLVSPRPPRHWENPMLPTIYWHALSGLCEAPAFPFLLLNCLIVTIIASSKLQSEKRGGQCEEEDIKRESVRSVERGDAKAAYHVAKHADDYIFEGKKFLSSCCSLDAHYKRKTRQEPVNFDLINDSMDIEIKSMKRLGHPGNIIDRDQPRQALNSTAHGPSLEEAWAAIVLSNKGDDPMVNCMQADQKRCNDIPPQPAAATDALSPPAAAAPSPAAHSPRRATKDAPAAKAQGGATVKQEGGDDQENDSELEELNRRAEEFIARFNQQMRLQLQRPHHLQLPVRRLLVG